MITVVPHHDMCRKLTQWQRNIDTIIYIIIHTGFWWPKNRVFHALCDKEGNTINIARTLCDQSFNIHLRLRYVVRIHSSENRALPRPP